MADHNVAEQTTRHVEDSEVASPRKEAVMTAASQDEDVKSKRVTLADLSAKGTALYAHGKFEEATEIFSKASILQAEINEETAPENAEILFHYGRSLFRVGQSKSDVLGAPAVTDKKARAAEASANGSKAKAESTAQKASQDGDEAASSIKPDSVGKDGNAPAADSSSTADQKKPLFQFTGDENFDNSDGDDADEEEDQEDDEDDLATAFEILDLARVCYLKQLDHMKQKEEAEKVSAVSTGESLSERHIKERLADTHDCLTEISLENERYPSAIEDGRISLNYKLELYPEELEIIAEAHYKLSLALEFASVTTSQEDGTNAKREAMDQGLRDEAIREMELAIKSFKLNMQNKEVELAEMASPEDNDLARKAIAEMREVVADIEQRLVDLRKDPIDASSILSASGLDVDPQSAAEMHARVAEAAAKATDLTGLVRKKKAPAESSDSFTAATTTTTTTKRKAVDEAVLPSECESPKKTKLDDEAATTGEPKAATEE